MQEEHTTLSVNDKKEIGSSIFFMRSQLQTFDEAQVRLLLSIIASYVQSMGLEVSNQATLVAQEILQEAILQALTHADRFDPAKQLRAWLLGIALNIIKHKKTETARLRQREFSLSQISRLSEQHLSEDDLLDRLIPTFQSGPEEVMVSEEQANALLSLVSVEDQHLLKLAFLEGFARDALAEKLGLTVGAARVRLHRALVRLRTAWTTQQVEIQRGEK